MNFPRSTLSSVPGVERERLGWQRVDLRGEGRALPSGFDFPRHRGGLTSQTAQGLPGVPGFQAESPVETARMFWSSEPSETVFSGSSGVLTTPLPPSCCSSPLSERPGPQPFREQHNPTSILEGHQIHVCRLPNSQGTSTLDPHTAQLERKASTQILRGLAGTLTWKSRLSNPGLRTSSLFQDCGQILSTHHLQHPPPLPTLSHHPYSHPVSPTWKPNRISASRWPGAAAESIRAAAEHSSQLTTVL